MAVATAAALAVGAAGWAYPHSHEVALASVEVERGQPSVTGEAPAETVGAPAAEEPAAQAGDPPVTGNPLWAIPMSKLSATRDRPLFSASRRPRTPTVAAAPSPQPVAVATSPAPEPPHLTLVGTIIGENSRIAIFFDENAKTSSGVREGEAVAGWMLRTVEFALGGLGGERPHGDARPARTRRAAGPAAPSFRNHAEAAFHSRQPDYSGQPTEQPVARGGGRRPQRTGSAEG